MILRRHSSSQIIMLKRNNVGLPIRGQKNNRAQSPRFSRRKALTKPNTILAQCAPFLDENVESSMCETRRAIHDPSASNLCDPCSGSAPKYDTDRCTLRALSDLAHETDGARQYLARGETRRRGQQGGPASFTSSHPTHAPGPTGSARSSPVHRQDQRKTLAPPHEATPVNTGGAQREGVATAETCHDDCALCSL